jgi:dTMP kinase
MTAPGRFITIEGGEGTGKSTQVGLLVEALQRQGIAVTRTREPGGSPGGERVRQLLLEGAGDRWDAVGEALLLFAARRDHVTRIIKPALEAGNWVVSDRFLDSTVAYQGYGRGMPRDDIVLLRRIAIGDFSPDLTIILDLPAAEGLARVSQRAAATDRFERLDAAFHERLRAGFQRIAADDPGRCVLIDAAGDPASVHQRAFAAVAARLGIADR